MLAKGCLSDQLNETPTCPPAAANAHIAVKGHRQTWSSHRKTRHNPREREQILVTPQILPEKAAVVTPQIFQENADVVTPKQGVPCNGTTPFLGFSAIRSTPWGLESGPRWPFSRLSAGDPGIESPERVLPRSRRFLDVPFQAVTVQLGAHP